MKKNLVTKTAHQDIDISGCTLSEIVVIITHLINTYGDKAVLIQDSGYENISNIVTFLELETDEEFKERKENERRRKEKIRSRELKELERLKKKYKD
jgi:hypothetical protein